MQSSRGLRRIWERRWSMPRRETENLFLRMQVGAVEVAGSMMEASSAGSRPSFKA